MKIALGDLCELGGGSWGKLGRTLEGLGGGSENFLSWLSISRSLWVRYSLGGTQTFNHGAAGGDP
jgi:hypothetical protein